MSARSPIPVVEWERLDEAGRAAVLARPGAARSAELAARVRRIVASVARGGDAALARWTARLDGARLARFEVDAGEIAEAEAAVSPEIVAAIDRAVAAVRRFHEAQRPHPLRVETAPGVRCELRATAIPAVGLYVPAGGAPLVSTALMLAVPAAVAGCAERVVVTPPRADGSADPTVVTAARRAGATRIVRAGGAQAIAALAHGTASVPRVDKIFGPGNAWVTEAKRQVAAAPGGPAIDLAAGPSELLVVADRSARADWVAADLLAQAEHAEDTHVVLITDDAGVAAAVGEALAARLAGLPRRAVATRALAGSRIVVTADLATALAVADRYAPEHLALAVAEPRRWLDRVGAAGAIYLGGFSAGSFGDYATGANHVLPTGGAARGRGGLLLSDFLRFSSVQEIDRRGLAGLVPTVATLARAEGLEGHARSAEARLADGRAA